MSLLQLYLMFTIAPAILGLSMIVIIFSMIVIFIGISLVIDEDKSMLNFGKNTLKISVPILLISMVLNICIPNSDQMIILAGTNYLSHKEIAQQMPDKVLHILNNYLDKALEKSK